MKSYSLSRRAALSFLELLFKQVRLKTVTNTQPSTYMISYTQASSKFRNFETAWHRPSKGWFRHDFFPVQTWKKIKKIRNRSYKNLALAAKLKSLSVLTEIHSVVHWVWCTFLYGWIRHGCFQNTGVKKLFSGTKGIPQYWSGGGGRKSEKRATQHAFT